MDNTLSQPRYILVARVPRDVEVRIEDAFLTLLGTSRPIAGFHITILGPFLWAAQPQEDVLAQVEQLCLSWKPFDVILGGLDAFPSNDTTAVYINIANEEPLLRLHSAIHALFRPHISLQREFPPEGYLPHITLGLGLNAGERDQVLASAPDERVKATFPVTEMHLLEERPGTPWRSIRIFPFEGQPRRQPYEGIEH